MLKHLGPGHGDSIGLSVIPFYENTLSVMENAIMNSKEMRFIGDVFQHRGQRI